MANCLTRICIEENRFEKKQRERQAEEQEEAEKQQLLAFKNNTEMSNRAVLYGDENSVVDP